jgi:hypothetical protein
MAPTPSGGPHPGPAASLGSEGLISMNWRPRPSSGETESWPAPYTYDHSNDGRCPELAEVLARLEAAARLRDPDAAARLLERLGQTEDGLWLLHQCAAAGLRQVAARISDGPSPHSAAPIPGVRSVGAA